MEASRQKQYLSGSVSAGVLWLSDDLAAEFVFDLAGPLTSASSTSSAVKWGHHFLANITDFIKMNKHWWQVVYNKKR